MSLVAGPESVRRLRLPESDRPFLLAGLAAILGTVLVLLARRVDTVEVIGSLLYLLVLFGALVAHERGGLLAGAVSALVFAFLRAPAAGAIGGGRFIGTIATRALAYLAFGAAVGFAVRTFNSTRAKIDRADLYNDETGLRNNRFFTDASTHETARARRYGSKVSIAVIDLPAPPIDALAKRERAEALAALGELVRAGIRTTDTASFIADGRSYRIGVILPETPGEGARIFANRMANRVSAFLLGRNVGVPPLMPAVATLPGDEQKLTSMLEEIAGTGRAPVATRPA